MIFSRFLKGFRVLAFLDGRPPRRPKRQPKRRPKEGPRTAEDSPKMPQDAPYTLLRGFHEGPKKRNSKWPWGRSPQDGQEGPQFPAGFQEASKRPPTVTQEASKRPQEASKRPLKRHAH